MYEFSFNQFWFVENHTKEHVEPEFNWPHERYPHSNWVYTPLFISTHRGHEETNFQKASCTLDASVKIYGCRVDDTLVTSFRVLENLSRDKIEKGMHFPMSWFLEQEEVIEQHTSKKIGVTNTIETNMNAICMEKYDLQFDVDPLFHKMSQKFDEGGIKGMLLNNLVYS